MEQKIKEVQEYFKQKMLKGEFVLGEKVEPTFSDIIIEDRYKFIIWISTTHDTAKVWESVDNHFIKGIKFTDEEQIEFRKIIEPKLASWYIKIGLQQDKDAFNKLAVKLGKEQITE
jgi:hypothetical protein